MPAANGPLLRDSVSSSDIAESLFSKCSNCAAKAAGPSPSCAKRNTSATTPEQAARWEACPFHARPSPFDSFGTTWGGTSGAAAVVEGREPLDSSRGSVSLGLRRTDRLAVGGDVLLQWAERRLGLGHGNTIQQARSSAPCAESMATCQALIGGYGE